MKTIRLLISILVACAFLVMGTMAHAGTGIGVGGHAMQMSSDDGVDRKPCPTIKDDGRSAHPVSDDASHCCTTSGACGFIVSAMTGTIVKLVEFTNFTTVVQCESSCIFPPESPPPQIFA